MILHVASHGFDRSCKRAMHFPPVTLKIRHLHIAVAFDEFDVFDAVGRYRTVLDDVFGNKQTQMVFAVDKPVLVLSNRIHFVGTTQGPQSVAIDRRS